MSYQPYHRTSKAPLASDADIARMHQKLAEKVSAAESRRPPFPASGGVVAPDVAKPKLEWLAAEPGKNGYYSICRRYSICWVTMSGVTSWEAWKLAGGSAWFRQLEVGRRSEAEARAAAQRDSEQ